MTELQHQLKKWLIPNLTNTKDFYDKYLTGTMTIEEACMKVWEIDRFTCFSKNYFVPQIMCYFDSSCLTAYAVIEFSLSWMRKHYGRRYMPLIVAARFTGDLKWI